MDYRERNYYLTTIDYLSYDMRLKYYKMAAPSLKIHAPYNHIKNKSYYDYVDGSYWQMMLSCKKEDSEALEYELRKAERNDSRCNGVYSYGSHFFKLSKEVCGQ
jgi:hypothetical protein